MKGAQVICGNCRDIMAGMPANSIDAIITDPPLLRGIIFRSCPRSGILWAVRKSFKHGVRNGVRKLCVFCVPVDTP